MARKASIATKAEAAKAAAEYVAQVAADGGRLAVAIVTARAALFQAILTAPVGNILTITPATLTATCRSRSAGDRENARSDCETLRSAFARYIRPEWYGRTVWVARDGRVTVEILPE